jgi:hypothetical protein
MSPRQAGLVLGAFGLAPLIMLPGAIHKMGPAQAVSIFVVAALIGGAPALRIPIRVPASPRPRPKMSSPTVVLMGAAGGTVSFLIRDMGAATTLAVMALCAGFMMALSAKVLVKAPRRQH